MSARLRRPRRGELLVLAGAAAMLVVMFLPWYGRSGAVGATWTAWQLHPVACALQALAIALALLVGASTMVARTPAIPVAATVWTTVCGAVATGAVIWRLLDAPGGAGLRPAAWIGLAAAVAIVAGAWEAMRDEREPAPAFGGSGSQAPAT